MQLKVFKQLNLGNVVPSFYQNLVSISIMQSSIKMYFVVQVCLAIRGDYVPDKSSTVNTKTAILSIKQAKIS